jgi:AraC-like DNA-binding protein
MPYHDSVFHLANCQQIEPLHAGLFIALGLGKHVERVLDSYEIIFVEKGTLVMHEDGQEFSVHAGQTLLLWAGRRHGGATPYTPGVRFYWVHFRLTDNAVSGLPLFHVPQHATLHDDIRLTQLFRWYLDDQESGRWTPASGSLLIALMLHEIAHAEFAVEAQAKPSAILARQAHEIIHSRYRDSLSTASIAAELDCHPDYLGRIYHQTYGLTLTEGVHQRRIRRAQTLLLEGGDAIQQIARQVGFEDQGYFRRIFVRLLGMSPSNFRRLYARVPINSE